MTEEPRRDQLESIAKKIRSASEKVDSEEAFSAEELRVLEALGRAHPEDGDRRMPRRSLLAAAALLLVGALAGSYLFRSPDGRGLELLLAMRPLDGVRSPGAWTSGDPFAIEVGLSEDGFLYLLHLDSGGELEVVFPLYDPEGEKWSHLGRQDGFVPAGATISVPDPSFDMDWTVDAPPGSEEFFIAFATANRIGHAELLGLREELRREADRAREDGIRPGAIASRTAELIARRFPGAQSVRSYVVE